MNTYAASTTSAKPLHPLRAPLPREQRDTLFVLGVLAIVLMPHSGHLPLWASLLAVLVLGWRAHIAWQGKALPSRWVVHALLVAAIAGMLLQFRTLIGAEAGSVLVILLLVLKTMEMRARRDAMVLFFLGFFTLLTLFLQSQSLLMAAAMLLGVWGLLAALVNAHLPHGHPPLSQAIRTAGWLLLWGAPLMAVLFVTFPRFPPLWGLPADSQRAKTGLSSDMEVGHIAQLAQDSTVAMRLRFLDGDTHIPSQSKLYFRGPVLSQFDGKRWTGNSDFLMAGASRLQPQQGIGRGIAYEVTMEPHHQPWLLTLDATLQAPQLTRLRPMSTPDLQWQTNRPITEVLRYTAEVHLDYRYGQQLSPQAQQRFTRLPSHSDLRTRAWGAQLQEKYGSQSAAIMAEALMQLRQGGYAYTLEPEPVAQDTADNFWFDQKAGFCEHIASAFTVLMRAAGVPARVVTGYQGGERNPVDGLWTIRQSDAHAWAEVWIQGDGWVRVDPTASVAPNRIGMQQRLRPPTNTMEGAFNRVMGMDQMQQLRAAWEALNHRWNDWVLGYSVQRQNDTKQWFQMLLSHYGARIAMAGAALVLVIAAWWILRRRQRGLHPWLQLLEQARQRLQESGITTGPTMGTQALSQAARAQWGDGAAALHTWLTRMEQHRYAAPTAQTPALAELRKEFRSLRWPSDRPT